VAKPLLSWWEVAARWLQCQRQLSNGQGGSNNNNGGGGNNNNNNNLGSGERWDQNGKGRNSCTLPRVDNPMQRQLMPTVMLVALIDVQKIFLPTSTT
jgi:hypothetical protein